MYPLISIFVVVGIIEWAIFEAWITARSLFVVFDVIAEVIEVDEISSVRGSYSCDLDARMIGGVVTFL